MTSTWTLFDEPERYLSGISADWALQLWRESSCEEFTAGRHSYHLTIEEGRAAVSCEVCHHNPLEEGDLHEWLSFGPIPVDLEMRTIIHPGGPWGGPEYDVEVEVTAR